MSKEEHWIDNGTSCVCPVCRCEVNNPSEYIAFKCPRCGFQDEKDQIDEMAADLAECHTEFTTGLDEICTDYDTTAKKMHAKGYCKQIVAEWIEYRHNPKMWCCSHCKEAGDHGPYCSHCGAKMKGQ